MPSPKFKPNQNLLTLCKWEIMSFACSNKGEEELYCSLYGSRSWSQLTWKEDKPFDVIRWHRHTPFSKITFSYLCFNQNKNLRHMSDLCFPLRRDNLLLLCWVSKPISLYLKQAFELLWSNHLCVLMYSSIIFYSSLCSTMLLSEWIYRWKFQQLQRDCDDWACDFCNTSPVIKAPLDR